MRRSNQILIIEDDEAISKLIRITLSNVERNIFEAGTAEEAMILLDQISFDIILIDIGLPGVLNGLSLAQLVLEHAKQRRSQVAIVTGSDVPGHIESAKDLGVAAYLMKPFSPEKLAAVVAKMEYRIADTLIFPPTVGSDSLTTFKDLKVHWPFLFV